jgi:membrane-bound hydrogenase subunit mbhJ
MYYWHWIKNIFTRPKTTGFPTQSDPRVASMSGEPVIPATREAAPRVIHRSLALRHLDAGSCNGCESELMMLTSPDYDFSRYGFTYTPSPKHADILVVTGVVSQPLIPVIQDVYEQLGHPKRVLAIGDCAINGGVFDGIPETAHKLETVIPVTTRVSGCPPTPADILRALFVAVDGVEPLGGQEVVK